MDSDANSVECGVEANVSGISTDVVILGPSWSTTTGCTAIVSPMALYVELSWPSCRISLTGPALGPGRWPNVFGTGVPSPVRRQVVRHRRPLDLITARRTTTLWPGKLLGLWLLLRRLMTPMFPVRRRLHCSSGLLAERRLALFQTGQPRRTSRRQSEPRPGFPLLSTVLHRRYRISPHKISLWNWIPHSHIQL